MAHAAAVASASAAVFRAVRWLLPPSTPTHASTQPAAGNGGSGKRLLPGASWPGTGAADE
eukprot:scaffold274372_cov18-Tisochrysis_lutea.AAC.1